MTDLVEYAMFAADTILVLPRTADLAELVQQALPGQIILLHEDNRPYAILTEEMVRQLGTIGPLTAYEDRFFLPTITTPGTPTARIVLGMLADPDVRWHVVMEGEKLIGILPPVALTYLFQSASQETWTQQDRSVPDIFKVLGSELHGDPFTEQSVICFHCPQDASHHWSLTEARQYYDHRKRAICPHDKNILIRHNPCPGVL